MRAVFVAVAAFLCGTVNAQTMDAEGPCPANRPVGVLRIARGAPWSGSPRSALEIAQFAHAHKRAASDEEPWLSKLSGQAGPNRVYFQRGRHVVVFAVCNPADCGGERAYIAFEPATKEWAANLLEGSRVRSLSPDGATTTLAAPSEIVGTALACAANLDMDAP